MSCSIPTVIVFLHKLQCADNATKHTIIYMTMTLICMKNLNEAVILLILVDYV